MHQRQLLVIADDFGIGPGTTAGILQLAARGIVTGSALLVNSPYADDAVQRWQAMGCIPEIGWHPNLTLDAPLATVPSLVQPDGTFWPLRQFMKRWFFGKLDPRDIEMEWRMQLARFIELVGWPPRFVNCHHQVGLFAPAGPILMKILGELPERPYLRRVREPWVTVRAIPGARGKRIFLNIMGRRMSRLQQALGFPGNDWLTGFASPACLRDADFLVRRLQTMPGEVVELMCHPGQWDPTLVGRDCTETDGLLEQRVNELRWLSDRSFVDAVGAAGFRLAAPGALLDNAAKRRRAA